MKCSPKYHGEERQDVGIVPCNSDCFHWKACLKELNVDKAEEDRGNWIWQRAMEKRLFKGFDSTK